MSSNEMMICSWRYTDRRAWLMFVEILRHKDMKSVEWIAWATSLHHRRPWHTHTHTSHTVLYHSIIEAYKPGIFFHCHRIGTTCNNPSTFVYCSLVSAVRPPHGHTLCGEGFNSKPSVLRTAICNHSRLSNASDDKTYSDDSDLFDPARTALKAPWSLPVNQNTQQQTPAG